MPGARALLSSLFSGVVVGLVADLWLRWPGFVSVAIGALFGIATLIVTGSFATRGAAADRAWQEAAPDLHTRARASTDPAPKPVSDAAAGGGVASGGASAMRPPDVVAGGDSPGAPRVGPSS